MYEQIRSLAVLIAERAGPDSAAIYRTLPREEKPQFLIDFWQQHNPVVLQFYYGYHIGRRYLTVSDAFFERGRLIPHRYKTRAEPPDPALLNDAVALFERILRDDANDRIALCALGYCLLEQYKGVEAERIFVRVLEKDRRFLIARHGAGTGVPDPEKTGAPRTRSFSRHRISRFEIRSRVLQSGDVSPGNAQRGYGLSFWQCGQALPATPRCVF